MILKILSLAKAEPDGFTIRLPDLEKVKKGIVSAYKETQNCFGRIGLEIAVNHAMVHERILGGWFNSENERFYFDSCKIFEDANEAIRFGRENEQIAIFDLTNLRVIEL
jgi:fructokinase